jgi:hypothetical protein
VDAVKALYASKTRALLGTISGLEAEVRALKATTKEGKRSQYIIALQQVRVAHRPAVRPLNRDFARLLVERVP